MYCCDKPETYYRFEDDESEVRFNRHDMPTPWMNYLTNGIFTVMMSHAGGGVAFYKSPQIFRINHYRFFHLPVDRSGFYTYIKDGDSIWCPTCQPAVEKPYKWNSFHGLGYTRFKAEHNGLCAQAVYFVGKQENALIWKLRLKSSTKREIQLYPFVELGMMEFMRELQWQCYNKHQLSVSWMDQEQALVYRYGVENQPRPEETPLVYFGADVPVIAYEGDRDEFIGPYRSEENPAGLEQTRLGNSNLAGGDPCFALQLSLSFQPGEEKEIHIYMGTAPDREGIKSSLNRLRQKGFPEKQLEGIRQEWKEYLEKFNCTVPDKETQRMVNLWNPYQAHRNFLFSRNISFYATGTFRGVGFRDTAQDILAMIPFDLESSKDKIRLLLTQQYKDGHVNHYFFPVEGYESITSIHSDDHLWIILTVWNLVMEEGSVEFLNEKIPFYDGGDCWDTVYCHLKQAIEFTRSHLGEQGFPLMLRSDWNDALFRVCKEGRGESIWTAMQLGLMLKKLEELAVLMKDLKTVSLCRELYQKQKELVNIKGWDGRWYRRAIMDNGEYIGCADSAEAQIWLNTQTWAVISGMSEDGKAEEAMKSVYERLNTPLGIKKIDPPIRNFPTPKEPLTNYNPGTGENASVFCHANTWAIIAECLLGNGDRAYEYYHQLLPSVACEKAGLWRYKAEPYAYASNIFGPDSLRFGLANVSWLTGTAAWMYLAVSQYILGIRASYKGITVTPCLPSSWNHVSINRIFRNAQYQIEIIRTGNSSINVNGEKIEGCQIPYDRFGKGVHKIVVEI